MKLGSPSELKYIFNNSSSFDVSLSEVSNLYGIETLIKVKEAYKKQHGLHAAYYETSDVQGKEYASKLMTDFLGQNQQMYGCCLSRKRFFELVPEILSSFTPQELEQMYAVNTVFRKKVVTAVAKKLWQLEQCGQPDAWP